MLAQLARTAARRKISQLEETPEGAEFFTEGHAALLATVLARIDRVNAGIDQLTAGIERLLTPVRGTAAASRVDARPGPPGGQDALAETGTDMARSPPARTWPPGQAAPRGPPVPHPQRPGQGQKRQPVPGQHHGRDRRRGRPHPDPRGRPLPAAGPPPRQGQGPDRPRQHPAEGLPQACCPAQACAIRTSARTTTSARPARAGRSLDHAGKLGALSAAETR